MLNIPAALIVVRTYQFCSTVYNYANSTARKIDPPFLYLMLVVMCFANRTPNLLVLAYVRRLPLVCSADQEKKYEPYTYRVLIFVSLLFLRCLFAYSKKYSVRSSDRTYVYSLVLPIKYANWSLFSKHPLVLMVQNEKLIRAPALLLVSTYQHRLRNVPST